MARELEDGVDGRDAGVTETHASVRYRVWSELQGREGPADDNGA